MTISLPPRIRVVDGDQASFDFAAFLRRVTDALNDVWYRGTVRVPSYTVATLPSAADATAGAIVFVSNETGGAVLAFSDGTNWRRVTDRAVVS